MECTTVQCGDGRHDDHHSTGESLHISDTVIIVDKMRQDETREQRIISGSC